MHEEGRHRTETAVLPYYGFGETVMEQQAEQGFPLAP